MPRIMRAKTDGQAQDITDNTTHSTANSRENKPEDQSGGIRNVPINGRWGSNIENKITKGIPVLIPTG
eukprot:3886071-Ditylum_brightwellii.AAC.1